MREGKKPKSSKSRDFHGHRRVRPNRNIISTSHSRLHTTKGSKYTQISNNCTMKDDVNYGNIDFDVVGKLCLKTSAYRFRENWKKKTVKNEQRQKFVHQPAPAVDKSDYCVNLPKIYSRLYLSNYQYAATIDNCNKYDVLINLNGRSLNKKYPGQVYYMPLSAYSNGMSFQLFNSFARKFTGYLQEAIAEDKSVLVHCAEGVNRSVLMIASFCILAKQQAPGDVLEYIQKEKVANGFPNWNTLRDYDIYHFLLALYQREKDYHYVLLQ